MALKVRTLGCCRVKVADLGGDVMSQGDTVNCRRDQAGRKEWDQGCRVSQVREFLGTQFMTPNVQLGGPRELVVGQRVILMALNMFKMNRRSQKRERINDLYFEVGFRQEEATRLHILRVPGCIESIK
jgi:hypothetical protein